MSSSEQHVLPQSRQPMPGSPEPPPRGPVIRSPAQIERDIESRRERLSGTIDAIAERVKPQNIARRRVEDVRERVAEVRRRLSDDQGRLRKEVVGAVAGAAVVIAVLVILQRRRS